MFLGRRHTEMPQDFASSHLPSSDAGIIPPRQGSPSFSMSFHHLPVACRAGRQYKDASLLRGISLLQEMEGMSTKLPLPSFPHAQHRLSFKQTPWPLSCQGTRAALESEFVRLLPWSKESETLPLETKQSIRHFTCQKYIQPPKKEILPAKEPATKPSIPPVKQSPASGISTGILILCPIQNHPK